MGRRGPPPLPNALRKMRGRRHRKKEPVAAPELPVGAPEMPAIIKRNPVARKVWTRVSKDLVEMGVLHPSHWAALAVLCDSYAVALEMTTKIQHDGLLLKARNGKLYTHPAHKIRQQAWMQFLRCAQEFGLTPSSATRVRAVSPAAAKQQKAKDDAESFLFGGKVVGRIGKNTDGPHAS